MTLTTNISATFDAAIDAATVSTTTFTAQGMQSGLITGTYSTVGDTVTLNPARSLFAGEVVRTTLSSNLADTAGTAVTPYQWQFTAGPVSNRCVSGFFTQASTASTGVEHSSVAWGGL